MIFGSYSHEKAVNELIRKLSITEEHADYMLRACSLYGITEEDFMKYKVYSINDSEKVSYISKKINKDIYNVYLPDKEELDRYSKKQALRSRKLAGKVENDMIRAYQNYRITPKEYYTWAIDEKTETKRARIAITRHRKKDRKSDVMNSAATSIGVLSADLENMFEEINKNFSDYEISKKEFISFGLYTFYPADEHMDEIKGRIKELIEVKEMELEVRATEENEIKEKYEEYCKMVAKILSPVAVKSRTKKLKKHWPDIKSDDAMIAADLFAMSSLFEYNETEYISFHFFNKDIKERLEFLTNALKVDIIKTLNDAEGKSILDNKYEAYTRLKEYYGRDVELINGIDDIPKFINFTQKHKSFVKKSNFDSLGRGLKKVDITAETDLKALYDELTAGSCVFLLEELIKPHEIIKKLNPDSVNTVRVSTIANGEDVSIVFTSMKIGRSGSFVDNGGAGGILVHVNRDTGVFDSEGIDEKGGIYKNHPDHGYQIPGTELPDWEQAMTLAKVMGKSLPGVRFVGWDLTYTEDEKWIVVEGNAWPQLIGQQATTDTGVKEEFVRIADYRK